MSEQLWNDLWKATTSGWWKTTAPVRLSRAECCSVHLVKVPWMQEHNLPFIETNFPFGRFLEREKFFSDGASVSCDNN